MKARHGIVLLAAMILLSACVLPVQAEGYTVQPAYGLVQEPVQDTGREVTFFELTPRAMIIFLVISISPAFVYPVEFFLMIKLFAYFGYRRIDEMAVLHNRNRRRIYDAIAEHPGVSFTALETNSGVKRATLKYHLRILGLKKKILRFGMPECSGYFVNNGRYSDMEKQAILHMRNSTTRRILEILSASPASLTRKEIAAILGITGPSVTWHTNRLLRDRIISISRDGRDAYIRLVPDAAGMIRSLFRQGLGPQDYQNRATATALMT